MKIQHYIMGVACAAVMFFGACSNHNKDAEHNEHEHADEHEHASDDIELSAQQIKDYGIQTTTLQPSSFAEVIETSGQILPIVGAETTITATMEGIVRYVNSPITEGSKVEKGHSIFVIDAKSLANGNPAAAAQTELAAAKKAFERAKGLADERIIPKKELEDAEQRYHAALSTAQSLGNASETRYIGAPISGIVKNMLVKPGDYVAMGQALATITQNARLQLKVDFPERFYNVLPHIQSANFRMAYDDDKHVYSLKQLGGKLIVKGSISNNNDGFVPLIFELNNRGNIIAGSYADVFLIGMERSNVLAVPNEAITEAQGLYFVYVQVHNDAFKRTEVTIGQTDGIRTEIKSGLKAGDIVVTQGAINVRLAANASSVPEGHSH